MMEHRTDSFGSQKEVLAIAEPFVAMPVAITKDQAIAGSLAEAPGPTNEGRVIIKAGTIYPANDATAIGVIKHDYDVTYGDANMAVILFGFIKTAALPVPPSPAAKQALKMIKFMPVLASDEELIADPVANIAASTANDIAGIVADHNALLAAMKTAGVMAAD